MKRTVRIAISFILVLVFVFCAISCDNAKEEPENVNGGDDNSAVENEDSGEMTGVWEDAEYLEDMEFGNGSKTITLEVKAEGQTVTFTVRTDKETVGEALMEHGLIDGEDSQYGLYVKKVNGIVADYDVDKYYWAFYVDGESSMTGVDMTEIEEGAVYRLERTK